MLASVWIEPYSLLVRSVIGLAELYEGVTEYAVIYNVIYHKTAKIIVIF